MTSSIANSTTLSDDSVIFRYFPDLSQKQQEQIGQLGSLYKEWNSKINVVSRKDIDDLYLKHVLHSMGISTVIHFNELTDVLDVGTGGGFPGIPLAILFPKVQFHLIDSIGKKIKVVQSIATELGLDNVNAQQERAENIHNKYDFIISRAVTRLKPFYDWVKNNIKKESFNSLKNGILYLKGGDLEDELREVALKHKVYELSRSFKEEFFQTKKVVHLYK